MLFEIQPQNKSLHSSLDALFLLPLRLFQLSRCQTACCPSRRPNNCRYSRPAGLEHDPALLAQRFTATGRRPGLMSTGRAVKEINTALSETSGEESVGPGCGSDPGRGVANACVCEGEV
ncbi:uncharacterized [Tachysurus ichikawai]